jgi:histone H2A
LAAIYEYLVGEIAEMAFAQLGKRKRITARNINLVVTEDEELRKLFRGTIAGGGVVPTLERKEAHMRAIAAEKKAAKK